MEYRKLGQTDLNLSIVGFGTATLGNVFGDIDAGEPGADDEHAFRLGGVEASEGTRRPRVLDQHGRGGAGRWRKGAGERLGRAARSSARCKADSIGCQYPPVGEGDQRRLAGRETHDLAMLESYTSLVQQLVQIAGICEPGCEAVNSGHGAFLQPPAEMAGILRPGRHPFRNHVEQVAGVGGAIGRPGPRTTRRIHDGDLGVGTAHPQVGGQQYARCAAPHDHYTRPIHHYFYDFTRGCLV